MSAPNFYNANASNIFMVSCEDDFSYQDTKDNVSYELEELGWDSVRKYDGERNYPGCVFSEKTKKASIGKFWVDVTVRAIIRSGYFSDANLDWDIEIDGTEYDLECYNETEALEQLESSYEYSENPGFCKMQAKNLVKNVEKAVSELTEELESVYEKYSERLLCLGIFSNGEAIYGKTNNPINQIKAS